MVRDPTVVPVLVTAATFTGGPHVWPPSSDRAACMSPEAPMVRHTTVTEPSLLTTGYEGSVAWVVSGVASTGAVEKVCPSSVETATLTLD